jgi:hypothetical protein
MEADQDGCAPSPKQLSRVADATSVMASSTLKSSRPWSPIPMWRARSRSRISSEGQPDMTTSVVAVR